MLLGILYEDGLGAQRDLQTAKKYYSKVCQMGENLGCKLYKEAKQVKFEKNKTSKI